MARSTGARSSAPGFSKRVIATYRGWHKLTERQEGWERAKWVLINDLSLSPVVPRHFGSVREVAFALEELRDEAPDEKSRQRLEQSLYYLRQKPGVRATREAVIKRGIPWLRVSDRELNRLRGRVQETERELVASGRLTKTEAATRFERRKAPKGVARRIQALSRPVLASLLEEFPAIRSPQYAAREVSFPQPWINMVTYEDDSLNLIANRGPLANYPTGRLGFLALHEICGHVLHFTQLLGNEDLRNTSPHHLCLSIHTSDAYFIEGIAQFITSLVAERLVPELTPLHLDVRYHDLMNAVRHKNIIELLEGRISIQEAAERHHVYTGDRIEAARKLYAAGQSNVFFACQPLVYHAGHMALLPALNLGRRSLERFLRQLLSTHHSPTQIGKLVSESLA